MENNKVYFASPWFTAEQEEREERLKAKLRSLGFVVHSPKEEAIVGTFAAPDTRQKIFKSNTDAIDNCDIVFAITDGKDMGTIWEAGYAYGANNSRPKPAIIVYYCETLGNGIFNLMLAQSGDIILTKFEDVDKLPELLAKGEKVSYVGRVE